MQTMYRYLRVYFERSNGMVVLDTGPGTERTEVLNVRIDGRCWGEHSPNHEERPRFWMALKHCAVRIDEGNMALIVTGDKR